MRRRLQGAFCVLIMMAAAAAAAEWRPYENPRFGTYAEVPASFASEPPPENGDGQRFSTPTGGTIAVYGSFDFNGGGLAVYRAFLIEPLKGEGWSLTYMPSGADWFVLSGVRGAEILYHRGEQPLGCGGDLFHHIEFRYPARDKALWAPFVEHGAASLDGPCG